MFLPVLQIMTIIASDETGIRIADESTALAATPGSDVHVVRVSDDTFTLDDESSMPHDDFASEGGLFCGNETGGGGFMGRIWMKFNLTHIPRNVVFTRATLNLYNDFSWDTADEPFGVYKSDIDAWKEETLTWDNEPDHNPVPIDVIESPSSPNMFLDDNWYEWEITGEVLQTINEDGILTLVLRQVDESLSTNSMKGFMSRENSIADYTNTIPNIALEYSIPTATGLEVDGFSTSPQIDYINNANPEFGWTFSDADPSDIQKNYELEVWNSSSFDETRLMNENNSVMNIVYDTAGAAISQPDTFMYPTPFRIQYKWNSSLISQSGVVDKLYFEVNGTTGTTTFTDLAIYAQCVESPSDLDYNYESNYEGRTPIQVLNRSEYIASTRNGFMIFDIENTFTVRSGLNLIIEIRHTGSSGTTLSGNFTLGNGGSYALRASPPSVAYDYFDAQTINVVTQGLRLELVSDDILSGGFVSNSWPFSVTPDETWRFQYKFNQSLFDATGTIDMLHFPVSGMGNVTYENLSVYLVETPVEGRLSHTDMDSNYGGQSPVLVLDRDEYTLRNTGNMLTLDIDDIFVFTATNDLLIELRFDSRVSGGVSWYFNDDTGGYRAFNHETYNGNDTGSYDLLIDFIFNANTVTYSGLSLVNATSYYWRVRTCDSLGIWGSWVTSSFKYEILTSLPSWSNFVETTEPIELGDMMSVSIDVTHTSGINQVAIEYDGVNHTMSHVGDTYSHSWIPSSAGSIPYTIFMESFVGTWNTVSDSAAVVDTTSPEWVTPPSDKVIFYEDVFELQLVATDLSGIDTWTVNDTVNFDITDGLITNKTVLTPGGYILSVTVNDTEGNSLTGTFIVAVLETVTITTTTTTITTTTTTTTSTTTTTTTSTSTTDTTTTSQTSPTDFGQLDLIHFGLIGVIVILIFVIIFQSRKS